MSERWKKKWLKRIISLMLALVLTSLPVFQEVSYAANNKKKTEQYLDGVFERFEAYAKGNYRYNSTGGLCADKVYYCHLYVDTLRKKTEHIKYEPTEDEGFFERLKNRAVTSATNTQHEINTAFSWASSTLTGTGLTKSAYMDYLSKIVAMQERSFLETAQAQAEYAIRVDVGEELINILEKSTDMALADRNFKGFQAKLGDLFGKEEVKRIKKVLKDAKKVNEIADFNEVLRTEITNVGEAYSLALCASQHREEMKFLEAVYEYSRDEKNWKLHQAAEAMMDAADIRVAGVLLADPAERAKNLSKFVSKTTGAWDLEECAEHLSDYVSASAKKLAKSLKKFGFADGLKCVSLMAANLSLIVSAIEIGAFIGRILWGNTGEQARAMLISDEVAEVLKKALPYEHQQYRLSNAKGDKYEDVHTLVSSAEALCYVRLSGEYTAIEAVRGEKGYPPDEKLDEMYSKKVQGLDGYYGALADIFPEPPIKIAVFVDRQMEHAKTGTITTDGEFQTPVVYIEGNEEAAKKINESPAIRELLDTARSEFEMLKKEAPSFEDTMWKTSGNSNLWVEDAYNSGQSLSLRFKDITYYGGAAHPLFAVIGLTFDTETGERLELSDVLNDEDPKKTREELKKLLVRGLEQADSALPSFTSRSYEELIEQEFLNLEPKELREHHWYFGPDGFHIIFDVYQIGPYVAGCISPVVPYEDLGGIIKSEYLPKASENKNADEGGAGKPKIQDFEVLPKVADGEMGFRVFGSKEKSYRGVTTKFAANDVFVRRHYTNVVFYTNQMDARDVVWLEDREKAYPEEEYTVTWGKMNP